jgi:hypothetical protein
MADLTRDPIINVIHGGIKRPITLLLENNCCPAAVILIYSGMDTMAFLGMPKTQTEVARQDFIQWAERYIHFPCSEQLSGLDLYGARCSVLHAHSTYSKLSREGKCRMIGYVDYMVPEARFQRDISTELVILSIRGLATAFFAGVDLFLVHLFADKARAKPAEQRLRGILHTLPFEGPQRSG